MKVVFIIKNIKTIKLSKNKKPFRKIQKPFKKIKIRMKLTKPNKRKKKSKKKLMNKLF